MSNLDKVGFRGILNRYTIRQNIVSWPNLILGLLFGGVCVWLYFTKDLAFLYKLLGNIVDVFVESIPDLLGFCIGGYALIVAINSLEKMPAILKPQSRSGMSYYQTLSADFALTLMVMCILLALSYVFRLVLDLELISKNEVLGKVANLVVVFIFLWSASLAIMMVFATIANLFSLSVILQTAAGVVGVNEEEKNKTEEGGNELSIYKVDSWLGSFTVTRLQRKSK